MAAESNNVFEKGHFDNGRNLTQGSRSSLGASGETIAEFCRRFRSGRFVGSVGDTTVTFDTAFPDANYTIAFAGESTAVPVIKDGTTPTAAGFVVTCAAIKDVHWIAIYDGNS
jgi:hypothetical protein